MTVVQYVLAVFILLIFAACAWLTHWDVSWECVEQADQEACEKGDIGRDGAHPDGDMAGASVPGAPFSEVYDWERETA